MRKSFSILWFLVCTLMVANAASYGIIVNGKRYFAGTQNPNPADPSFEEYMVLGVPLKSGDVLALYDADNKASWAVTLVQSSTAGISKSGDQYSCSETGCYDFYIKLKYQSDQLYVEKGADDCSDWGQDVGDDPTPAEEGFGIIINGSETVQGWKNEGQTEFLEYMIESDLTAGTTFQLYDFGNMVCWTEENIDEASTPNVTINASGVYEAAADGHYTIYLKMYGLENNQVYIGYVDPTSIREATIKAAVKKMVVDGIFYIVKDNKAYTVFGF